MRAKFARLHASRLSAAVSHSALLTISLFSINCTAAEKIERIEVRDKNDGVSKHSFASGQYLSDLALYEITSYEGEWRNGLAHGEGILRFHDTESTGYMSITLKSKPNYYIGNFIDGRPAGDGTLVHSSTLYTQNLRGMFSDNQVVFSIEGQEVSVITGVPGEKRALVRAMQYAGWHQQQPSRIFFGEIGSDGVPSGAWVDVPWFIEDGDVSVVGFGRMLEQHHRDGSRLSCSFNPRSIDPKNLVNDLIGLSGNIDAQRIASIDQQYFSKADCVSTNPHGWTWSFTADYSFSPAKVTYHGCKTPSGKTGKLRGDGTWCDEKKKSNQDVFTNMANEFKRFVDRRILGSIDKIGGSMEKAMCRATGTEPGKNCNVNVAIGASWPLDDGPAPQFSEEEQAVRNAYIAAAKRASALPGTLAGTPVGDAIAMSADLNAICTTLCHSEAQRQYSAALLNALEQVASQSIDDNGLRRVASIQRETASVLSAGLRGVTIGSAIAAPVITWFRFWKSTEQAHVVLDAMDAVRQASPGENGFEFERQRLNAMKTLTALQMTSLNNMLVDGTSLLGTAIATNIRILRGFPPQRVRALTAAIQIGRTAAEVQSFIDRYKDVGSEKELYDAIIKEALAPIGIAWPQQQKPSNGSK